MFDCLRANKATMAHGLEVRVPFLDKGMIDETMMIDGNLKMRIAGGATQFVEKWLLREAFNTPETPYLYVSSSDDRFATVVFRAHCL